MNGPSMRVNALSIDLEEWYHAEFLKNKNISKIDLIGPPTEILLSLLNKYNTKATFFIVGEVARNNPDLIRKIYKLGHEIAIHGFTHSRLCDIGPEGLRHELLECKDILHNISGEIEIKGFRAPSFSLNHNTNWAIDILKELQIKYDSSLFPLENGLYGVKGVPLDIYGISSNNIKAPDPLSTLKEFPITVVKFWKLKFPISGGFYLRFVPFFIQKIFLKLINKERSFIIYIHPWECYMQIPRIPLSPVTNFICYFNKQSSLSKFEALLKNFKFDRLDKVLGI